LRVTERVNVFVPTHAEKKYLPYTPAEMFDLVSDIEKYPEFLPWCVGTRIRSREGDLVVADMIIGYKMFRERFTSRVTLQRPDRIDVAYSEGPFKYLQNHWTFNPDGTGTTIDFFVDFRVSIAHPSGDDRRRLRRGRAHHGQCLRTPRRSGLWQAPAAGALSASYKFSSPNR
jgi:coenzyme Q-binding protein COQ10